MSTQRAPLDKALVTRGLAVSIEQAQDWIKIGAVRVNGSIVFTPTRQVATHEVVAVKHQDQFVSRGGVKLDAAIMQFKISVEGKRALDAGSSTGGFSDCLLQRGISNVVAIDVGKSQLHERIARDSRVSVVDSFNVRRLAEVDSQLPEVLGGVFDVVVADLSFISLKSVSRALCTKLSPQGDLVVLVKPQFEATKAEVDRGKGVITDQLVRSRVLAEVGEAFTQEGAHQHGCIESPIHGAEGNVEYLVWYRFGE